MLRILALLLSTKGNLMSIRGKIDVEAILGNALVTLMRHRGSYASGFGSLSAFEVKLLRDHLGQVHTLLDNVPRFREQARQKFPATQVSDIDKDVSNRFRNLIIANFKDSLLLFYYKAPVSIEPRDVEALGMVLLAEVNFHGIVKIDDPRLTDNLIPNALAHAKEMTAIPFELNGIVSLSRRLKKVLEQHRTPRESNRLATDPNFIAWVTQLKLFLDRKS